MLLGEVFQSLSVWQKITGFRMTPFMAYQLLKYFKLVAAEYDIAEKQRVDLIRKLTNTKEGEDARINAGTPEFENYVKQFNAILSVEADLKPCSLTIDDVMGAIYDEKENSLTVQELMVLEPFFNEK